MVAASSYIIWRAVKEFKECSTFRGYAVQNTGKHIAEIVASAEREKLREDQ